MVYMYWDLFSNLMYGGGGYGDIQSKCWPDIVAGRFPSSENPFIDEMDWVERYWKGEIIG
jgi:hypothetical protein